MNDLLTEDVNLCFSRILSAGWSADPASTASFAGQGSASGFHADAAPELREFGRPGGNFHNLWWHNEYW